MFQPRLLGSLRALERGLPNLNSLRSTAATSLLRPRTTTSILTSAPSTPPLAPSITSLLSQSIQVRHASHATQGTANRHSRDPAGKRLGAKRTGGEYVVPGCIIFRQRGTKWFPGENCAMGRDHTIYASESGYVRYYLDPERHPDRKYIGIVFEKDGKLPVPKNAPSRRRLGRVAVKFEPEEELAKAQGQGQAVQGDLVAKVDGEGTLVGSVEAQNAGEGLQLRPGYMYREANWQIGRAAEKAGITAQPFNRKNRWLAWRKRQARADRAAQMKSLKGNKKKKKGGK
ncbi:ribosomal protein L27 [Aspergillus ellipticus CBS 707.79]|uniref:Large ribosomal subunit protein bL27m n=1 Tax=Aspergillus ellipticus CBS 707.79 TaxID=1448320 RepID=A0A319E651_9EURO|nr:ribosomal protein L27 [Aspergillus ellipticus CBS 707.79]